MGQSMFGNMSKPTLIDLYNCITQCTLPACHVELVQHTPSSRAIYTDTHYLPLFWSVGENLVDLLPISDCNCSAVSLDSNTTRLVEWIVALDLPFLLHTTHSDH